MQGLEEVLVALLDVELGGGRALLRGLGELRRRVLAAAAVVLVERGAGASHRTGHGAFVGRAAPRQ